MKIQNTIEIEAQQYEIWPYLVDPEKILKWYSSIRKLEYTNGHQQGVGTPFYFEEKIILPIMKLNVEISEWKENNKVAFNMTSGNLVKNYIQEWILEPTSSGTKFTLVEEIELPYGIIGKILGFFVRIISKILSYNMMFKLKKLLEENPSKVDLAEGTLAKGDLMDGDLSEDNLAERDLAERDLVEMK